LLAAHPKDAITIKPPVVFLTGLPALARRPKLEDNLGRLGCGELREQNSD